MLNNGSQAMENKFKDIAERIVNAEEHDGSYFEMLRDDAPDLANGYLKLQSALESANAEIADLKATEKVYHMNRDWIADAKIKIASLEDELSKVPMRFSSYINMATHCDTMSQLQREAADALIERDNQITQLKYENKKLTDELTALKKHNYDIDCPHCLKSMWFKIDNEIPKNAFVVKSGEMSKYEKLEAENKKLREALKEISEYSPHPNEDFINTKRLQSVGKIAREAGEKSTIRLLSKTGQ